MSSKIVRVFYERCESAAYCAFLRAVRVCRILRSESLLAQAHVCEQTHSATARHEHGAYAECEWHRSGCEADAYSAVRACSHKRMYADRLIARQRDMSMERMRNANGTARDTRIH